MKVYISGPYSNGNKLANVNAAIDAAQEVWVAGHDPYIPHLTHYWDERHSHSIDDWMEMDLSWLSDCDAVLRLPGESGGADMEVARALELGIPVVYEVKQLAYLPV